MQKRYGKTRDYQVVSEEEKSVSFSFSPVNPPTNTDHNSDKPHESWGFVEIPAEMIDEFLPPNATDSDVEAVVVKALEIYYSDEHVFNRLIENAEDSADMALALAEVLSKNGIHWSRTAKILSGQLQKHVAKLKEFDIK